ncbi:MAG: DMT family transporter [Gammaproteobacteria bacterium]|nr:DMT family transporter [Gammaproteobacteria bacterium]
MSVPAAFLGVILIWSTTPLAIQWSSEGAGFLFGVAARMWLGALVCVLFMALLRLPLPRHRAALRTYLVAGLGIFGAMSCVYWSAQFIPSGLISVLYGLTPMVTGVLASLWLEERAFSPARLFGMLAGLGGLAVIFGRDVGPQQLAVAGMLGVLASVVLHSLSSVWVKRIGADVPAFAVTGGGLLVAAPLFLISWLLFDGQAPTALTPRAAYAILYLGLMGSVVGFMLFYYVLRRMAASHLALVTLVTPVLALGLGHVLNDEALEARVWLGAGLILTGLVAHQWGDRLLLRGRRRSLVAEPQPAARRRGVAGPG